MCVNDSLSFNPIIVPFVPYQLQDQLIITSHFAMFEILLTCLLIFICIYPYLY